VTAAPIELSPAPPDSMRVRCARGRESPRAIAWFGFSSFWGHMRHLLAAIIATDSVDSRKWMIPDVPSDLLGRAIAVLEPRGAQNADTLAAALGGEAWIDFVADTGDDATVSEAVARLFAAEYAIDDGGERLVLPRGDVLVHGGDLAYPVATVREMTRRLVEPWNRVLIARYEPARPRVLLAIPGNHDWYDGLDGFARLCQAPCTFEEPTKLADALHPHPDESPVLAWAEAFARGDAVNKPGAMALAGYVPVQQASYFRMRLARGLELFGVDRQLRRVDSRQKAFFASTPGDARVVIMPDPARAWGEARPNGVATLASIEIEPSRDPTIVLTGDIHHYERSSEGPSLHVIAGGGGAFLQGARIPQAGAMYARDVEFPGPRASSRLVARLPWHVASGGAGWLITSLVAVGDALALTAYFQHGLRGTFTAALIGSVLTAIGTALLVGWRRHRSSVVVPLSIAFGLLIGALPVALGVAADVAGIDEIGGTQTGEIVAGASAWLVSTFASGFMFGAMLMTIGRLGLNHSQPFAALGSAGYKHFLRMRIREPKEGTATIDGFVIGVIDPVGGSPPVLVDRFRWSASASLRESERGEDEDRENEHRKRGEGSA
jgi:hypothetical protein